MESELFEKEKPKMGREFQVAAALFSETIAVSQNTSSHARSISNQTALLDTSFTESSASFSQLEINIQSLVLSSGDIKQLPLSVFDEQQNKRINVLSLNAANSAEINAATLECFVIGVDQYQVKILPNCRIGAIKPGKLQIQARLVGDAFSQASPQASSQTTLVSNIVHIEVVAKGFNIDEGGLNLYMEPWQSSVWISLMNLTGQAFYRATLMSNTLSSVLPESVSVALIPSSDSMSGMCRNNAPNGANRVSCYFHAEGRYATVIVHNNSGQAFTAQLNVTPEQQKRQFSVAYTKEKAKDIYVDSPVREYVFANELGTNNTHFYRFSADVPSKEKLRIRLFDYPHLIALNVSWGNKVCTNSMKSIMHSQSECIIEEYDGSEVMIEIEGNNGVELLNAPAAVDGGTDYSLLVEWVN